MIIINGFPKCGTHAVVKACELLGLPAGMQHVPYGVGPCDVFIKRDPRDALLSRMRMDGNPLTVGYYLTRFRRYVEQSLCEEMAQYVGWLTSDRLVLKFEDFIANDTGLRQLAAYLNVPYQEDAFPNLEGLTWTWNAVKSDHRTLWTPEVEAIWEAEGGRELVEAWGYSWSC